MGNDKRKKGARTRQRRREQRRAVFFLVLIIIVAVYIIGAVFYSKHFYGKDMVFGIKVSNQTVESLKEKIKEKVGEYQLTVTSRTGDEVITAADIDLAFDDKGIVDDLKAEQSALLWFTGLFSKGEDIDVDVTLDETLLQSKTDSFSFMQDDNMQEPVDAHLEYSDGKFQIIKEDLGTQLDTERVHTKVSEAVMEGESSLDLDAAGCYTEPDIYEDSEELAAEQTQVNDMLDVEIIYDFSDRQEVVNSDLISQWITFGEDFTFELDQEKVEEYMHELGLKYDTFGLSREFTTSLGETITLKGGDYGWLIGKTKSAEVLIEKIKAGESGTIEPEYRYTGKCRDTNDIGDTYIEVSIANQRMWCYVDGECIVDTPVVTGNINIEGRATPSGGVWAIDAKMTDYNLVGEGYNSHVNYWMPFNGNVGVHDATWRDSFGGSIYKTNGSHGCVNTPLSNAKKIYENVSIGTPVVVY